MDALRNRRGDGGQSDAAAAARRCSVARPRPPGSGVRQPAAPRGGASPHSRLRSSDGHGRTVCTPQPSTCSMRRQKLDGSPRRRQIAIEDWTKVRPVRDTATSRRRGLPRRVSKEARPVVTPAAELPSCTGLMVAAPCSHQPGGEHPRNTAASAFAAVARNQSQKLRGRRRNQNHLRPPESRGSRPPSTGTSVESAEQWLLRLVTPYDDAGEDWASDIGCLLHQRWREYPMFAGGPEAVDQIKERIEAMPQRPSTRFCGAKFGVAYGERPCLFTFARSATEVARCMPDVQVAGGIESGGDPRQWLAIDVAHTLGDVAALREFGARLGALGFGVRRYEWRDGRSALLTIHAGDGTVEDLERSLAAAMPAPRPAWAVRYRPWSWQAGVSVHRHREPAGWRLREWLDQEIGLPLVGAESAPDQDVVLNVPVAHVDRAIELLARKPADL
jgi:hypothetical protein